MKKIQTAILAALLAIASPANAEVIPLAVTDTGINGDAIAAAATTDPIHMEKDGKITNQLSITVVVTPGTSAAIRVTCYESELKTTNFGAIPLCDSASPSNCVPDIREFTLADYDVVGGKNYITTRWHITKAWAKCSVVDPAAGSGTIAVVGTRSWQ